MAKETCVFCGEEAGFLNSDYITCGPTGQFACRSCAKELQDLDAPERCRRALRLGLAKDPQKLQEYLDLAENAEDARPACLRCGEKLHFGPVQTLDNSPYRDGLLSTTFDVLPAYCSKCGKMEFYAPDVIANNKLLSYLCRKDNGEIN